MPMFSRVKISKRIKNRLPMITPGTRDNDILPSSGSSMGSGLSLDYSALNMGGIDNGVPFNHADDGYLETVEVNEVEDDDNKGRGSYIGTKEEGFAFRHNLDYGSTANLKAVVIKGNIRFIQDNPLADVFYNDIAAYLNKKGYVVSLEFAESNNLPPVADLWIGHSKGLRKLNACQNSNTKLLAFGALPERSKNPTIIFSNHPKDEEALRHRHVVTDEHYVFTDEMKSAIDKITAELNKKAFPDWQQYNGNSQMYEQVNERPDAFTTPHFNLWNTYYAVDDEYGLRPLKELKLILPQLTKAAQKVYDGWVQDEDDELNGGGICHLIADAMCDEMGRAGIECATVSYSIGEVHVAAIAKLEDGVYTVDIPPSYYETGGGYTWNKIPNVVFDPNAISITKESSNPDDFPKYISDASDKKAWLNLPQYSDPAMYEQIGNPRNTMESEFNIFETYFVDDEIEITEDNNDQVETEDEVKKEAFLKTAVTYDSNQIIQDLIKIPQVKALIDQEASGFVDKIIVTTPGADIQQTQQQLSQPSGSGLPPITLQPISGDPYGHVWVGEDPTTHQKKPLDKIVRVDKVTDQWGTLVTILHEIAHHRHPDWSESQVESEAETHANTVKQYLGAKDVSGKTNILFVKRSKLHLTPFVKCDVADTYQKQVIGLQSYSSLRPESGLLFVYTSLQPLTFWMGKVAFPIDIIFADQNNQIVKIYRNCQPNSSELFTCDKASKVIEVVGSFCAFHDIDVGDHVFYANDKEESLTRHILEQIKDAKLSQQKDLDMTDWNIKIVMKKNPDSRRFLKVSWSPEDYRIKKADILVNPNPELIRGALKEMPLDKLVRHALLHILAGAKNELPEDKEQKLITNRLY